MYTIENLLAMSPMDFMKWAIQEFHIEIPTSIQSIDDAEIVGELLAKSSNKYLYLCELQGQFKILSRDAGRRGDKQLKEDIIDKNTLIDEIGKGVKQQYATLSRMITVRYNNLEELKMSDGRGFTNYNNKYIEDDLEDDIYNSNKNIPNTYPETLPQIQKENNPITYTQDVENSNFKSIYDEVPF